MRELTGAHVCAQRLGLETQMRIAVLSPEEDGRNGDRLRTGDRGLRRCPHEGGLDDARLAVAARDAASVSRQNGRYAFGNARRMEEEGMRIEPVSGVGDDAFWVGDPLHTLYFLDHTMYVS